MVEYDPHATLMCIRYIFVQLTNFDSESKPAKKLLVRIPCDIELHYVYCVYKCTHHLCSTSVSGCTTDAWALDGVWAKLSVSVS